MKKITSLFCLLAIVSLLAFSFSSKKRIILIDAGHGGKDAGAKAGDYHEKDITLKTAQFVKSMFRSDNTEIILSRNDNSAPSLAERTELINKVNPDMVISLHTNFAAKANDKKGAEIFYADNKVSTKMAAKLAEKFNNCPVSTQNLHLLKNSKSPIVILEMGYMSNAEDLQFLSSENGQREIARKINNFINEN